MNEPTEASDPKNVVDEVRASRAWVVEQAGGFSGLGKYLKQVENEFRTRTGRFADLPLERSGDVQRRIDAAETDEPILDEIRGARGRRQTPD
ncbi:MAG: hypothetical protein HOP29_08615 [Phycisphaerales bacterium]|nr:hypothetical protein [Phycisphaerales bacterium]